MNADELQLFQMGIANLKFLNHKLFAICDHSQLILLHLYVVANVTTQSGRPTLLEDRLEGWVCGGTAIFSYNLKFNLKY